MRARYTVTAPLDRANDFRGTAVWRDGRRRDVVITRVLPGLAKPTRFVAMFLDDLRDAMRLSHPNIVELIDIARTPDDAYFIVTEYIEGCDLRSLVRRCGPIATGPAIHVLVACCNALAHAHSLDVIHRDVSPRAIVVSTSGQVKLRDAGHAKVSVQLESSEPGIVKGKFGYLSPEAAKGEEVDHRSDVFSAGIVLWELLAGRRLFLGDTDYQTVELVRAGHIPAIEGLDPALEAIVRKALAVDVDARYQTAAELAEALLQHGSAHGLAIGPATTAAIVRDVKFGLDDERAKKPVDRETLTRVQAEVLQMVSVVDAPVLAPPKEWN